MLFRSVQGISGHNNKPSSTVYKQLYVSTLATKKAREGALQIMVEESSFLKDHTFHQAVLLAVTYDRNKNQILLSFAIVVFYTEDNWLWLKHQLEQFFPGSHVHIADYSKGIESWQFQDCIRNSGCFLQDD